MPYQSNRAAARAMIVSRVAIPTAQVGARVVRQEVVDTMLGSTPTGAEYPDRIHGGTHRASRAGEPPAVQSGDYVRSWSESEAVEEGGQVVAHAYTALAAANGYNIGRMLEEGTERMRARPHALPGALSAAEKMKAITAAASRR